MEKHACVQALHVSFINSLSSSEKSQYISDSTLNLSDTFFEDALKELMKQLNESEAETLPGVYKYIIYNNDIILFHIVYELRYIIYSFLIL